MIDSKYKYLSLGFNVPKIANLLGYNKTSIYRELILNSVVENKRPKTPQLAQLRNCKNVQLCLSNGIKKCPKTCMKYLAKTCSLIKKPYEVCNFCISSFYKAIAVYH